MNPKRSISRVSIQDVRREGVRNHQDVLAVEEPLEIRLAFEDAGQFKEQSISVTMRTPGDDFELAAGFLFSEFIVRGASDIAEIGYCAGKPQGAETESPGKYNIVNVRLRPGVHFDASRLSRHFYMSSSCGVCGKTTLEALSLSGCAALAPDAFKIDAAIVFTLPEKLRAAQSIFEKTGGLHAAGLFDLSGKLIGLREDVGRHNALDKLIGARLLGGQSGFDESILVLSGRTSFDIMQKALIAKIPIVAAVGAPSSLAVDVATGFGITLLGFMRGDRFNIYSGAQRILCLRQ